MKPIINPWMFYLVDCLDGLKMVCIIAVPVLVIVIAILSYIIEDLALDIDDLGLNKENELKSAIRTRKIVIFFSILILIVIPFIPSKETCYKMMVSSQITDNNIQKAEDVIKDSVDYIFEKINERQKNGET